MCGCLFVCSQAPKKSAISGVRDGRLQIKVAAPALQGRANMAVVELIGEALGVRKSAVSVRRGQRHRDKELLITGVARQSVENHLC
ncbi:MAG: DUF167 domain-containing protein [Acidimicrobiales bacterium]